MSLLLKVYTKLYAILSCPTTTTLVSLCTFFGALDDEVSALVMLALAHFDPPVGLPLVGAAPQRPDHDGEATQRNIPDGPGLHHYVLAPLLIPLQLLVPHLEEHLPLIVEIPQPGEHGRQLLIFPANIAGVPVQVGQVRVGVDLALELETPGDALLVGRPVQYLGIVRGDREFAQLLDDVRQLLRELVERRKLLVHQAVLLEVGVHHLPDVVPVDALRLVVVLRYVVVDLRRRFRLLGLGFELVALVVELRALLFAFVFVPLVLRFARLHKYNI